MGFTPRACLIYGVPLSLHDENGNATHPLFEDEERGGDLSAFLAAQTGATDPWTEVPDDINQGSEEAGDAWMAANPDWVARKDAWRALTRDLEAECPVEIEVAGHYDDPDDRPTYLALKDHRITADAWHSKPVTAAMFEVDNRRVQEARTFCEAHGLPAFDDPLWHLIASYG